MLLPNWCIQTKSRAMGAPPVVYTGSNNTAQVPPFLYQSLLDYSMVTQYINGRKCSFVDLVECGVSVGIVFSVQTTTCGTTCTAYTCRTCICTIHAHHAHHGMRSHDHGLPMFEQQQQHQHVKGAT